MSAPLALPELRVLAGWSFPRAFPKILPIILQSQGSWVLCDTTGLLFFHFKEQRVNNLSPGFNNLPSINNVQVGRILSFFLGQDLFSSWGSSESDSGLEMSMELCFWMLHG